MINVANLLACFDLAVVGGSDARPERLITIALLVTGIGLSRLMIEQLRAKAGEAAILVVAGESAVGAPVVGCASRQ